MVFLKFLHYEHLLYSYSTDFRILFSLSRGIPSVKNYRSDVEIIAIIIRYILRAGCPERVVATTVATAVEIVATAARRAVIRIFKRPCHRSSNSWIPSGRAITTCCRCGITRSWSSTSAFSWDFLNRIVKRLSYISIYFLTVKYRGEGLSGD